MRLKLCMTLLAVAFAALVSDAKAQAPRAPATTVVFRNDLPATYVLRHVRLWVDGVLVVDGAAPFAQPLSHGRHLVSIEADYRMQDALLPYVRKYTLQLRSAERVRSEPVRVVRARAVEVGGVTTPVQRRAQIVWR